MTKLSLLFFYRRLFDRARKLVKATEIVGCVLVAWCIALTFTIIFSCQPVAFFWDRTIKRGSCIDELKMGYGMTATNVVTDFVVLFLPVPTLWNVQMATANKRAIFGIFLLGGL